MPAKLHREGDDRIDWSPRYFCIDEEKPISSKSGQHQVASKGRIEFPVNWQKQRANFYFQPLSICSSRKAAKDKRSRASESTNVHRQIEKQERNERNRWVFACICYDKRSCTSAFFLFAPASKYLSVPNSK